jgi:hypothetical protein
MNYVETLSIREHQDKHQYWKTRDGRNFWIPDMEDKHLVNTVKFLEREYPDKNVIGWAIYKSLVNKLNKRGINANKEWDD